MVIFVATSKRFYEEAEQLVNRLVDCGITVYHPYFHLDPRAVDADPEIKSAVTLQHFPEIDKSEILYALLPEGYIGCSVIIELTYGFAKGKKIIASEQPREYAVRPIISEICDTKHFFDRFRKVH